ncbi:ComEA family DNA-binding protein [Catellatospora coxensis]|nr:helix-hairpin-helix domain-containing protein [Catellatospora coxensis]
MAALPVRHLVRTVRWYVLHSWWLLLPLFGCSCLGGLGFLYVGLLARRTAWWVSGLGYLGVSVLSFALRDGFETDTPAKALGVALFIAGWLGSVIHSIVVNVLWLQWLADPTPRPRHQPTPAVASAWPGGPVPAAPPASPPAVPLPPQVPATPPPAGMVDVNTVSAEQLAGLPFFDAARAERVLAERHSRGRFGYVEEFAAAAQLAPHEYTRLLPMLVVITRG